MKYILSTISFVLGCLLFCNANAQKNALRLSIIQDNKEIAIARDTATVVLKRDGFKLVFNSFMSSDKTAYATQIDGFFDAKGASMIRKGILIDDISYFAGGTGMACDMGKEYDMFYIDKDFSAHHYIYYKDNKDNRAALESRNGDTLRLSWSIKKYTLDGKDKISFSKIQAKDMYLVVLNDFNKNGKVDAGEYAIVHIIFE